MIPHPTIFQPRLPSSSMSKKEGQGALSRKLTASRSITVARCRRCYTLPLGRVRCGTPSVWLCCVHPMTVLRTVTGCVVDSASSCALRLTQSRYYTLSLVVLWTTKPVVRCGTPNVFIQFEGETLQYQMLFINKCKYDHATMRWWNEWGQLSCVADPNGKSSMRICTRLILPHSNRHMVEYSDLGS